MSGVGLRARPSVYAATAWASCFCTKYLFPSALNSAAVSGIDSTGRRDWRGRGASLGWVVGLETGLGGSFWKGLMNHAGYIFTSGRRGARRSGKVRWKVGWRRARSTTSGGTPMLSFR